MSYPEMMAVPLVGEMSPVSILNVVVLPAPKSMFHNHMFNNEGKVPVYIYTCTHVRTCIYMYEFPAFSETHSVRFWLVIIPWCMHTLPTLCL